MSRPSLLLLDEPSMGLAPILVGRFFETIKEIAATCLTVLMVEQKHSFSLGIDRSGVGNGERTGDNGGVRLGYS